MYAVVSVIVVAMVGWSNHPSFRVDVSIISAGCHVGCGAGYEEEKVAETSLCRVLRFGFD